MKLAAMMKVWFLSNNRIIQLKMIHSLKILISLLNRHGYLGRRKFGNVIPSKLSEIQQIHFSLNYMF